jgi:RHS repeat-associated protein
VVSRSAIGNHWLWQGQWFDYEAGLVYMRARHYDPLTGHFLQRDPLQYEDSVNLYAAMANNPVSYRDPTGLAGSKVLDTVGGVTGAAKSSGSGVRSATRSAAQELNLAELRRSLDDVDDGGDVFSSYRGTPGPIDRSSAKWKEATEITDSNLTGVHRRQAIQPDEFGPQSAGYEKKWLNDQDQFVPEGTPGAKEWAFRPNEHGITHRQGYKLHITTSAEDALIVARAVDEVLDSMGIHGKVVRSETKYAQSFSAGKKQQGKFWTVYIGADSPSDTAGRAALKAFVDRLDPQLKGLRDFGGIAPGPIPKNRAGGHATSEQAFGESGFIFGDWNDDFYK